MIKKYITGLAVSAISVSAFAGGIEHAPLAPVSSVKKQAGVYVGAQLGYVEHDAFNNVAEPGVGMNNDRLAVYSKEQSSFGVRFYAGHLFNQYVGLELGAGTYGAQKFAQLNSKAGQSASATPYNVRTTARLGFDLDVVGRLPMTDRFYAFMKAGMAAVDFASKALNGGSLDNAGRKKVSHWNWMPRAEAGLGYSITSCVVVTVSYAHYFGVNGSATLVANPNTGLTDYSKLSPSFGLVAVGMTYRF